MATFNASQWTLFPIGVLVTLYGVYLMSSRDMAIEEDEEVLLDDKGSKQDEADVKLARPRFATEHPHLAKALLPFTLLDNPVLRSESDAMTPMVRGSKRHLSRKSRMVSRTGVFMPLALDHGMCSSATVRAQVFEREAREPHFYRSLTLTLDAHTRFLSKTPTRPTYKQKPDI